MSDRVWIGVDIGGTKTAVVLSAELPEVLERRVFPTLPAEGPRYALACIQQAIRQMLSISVGARLNAIGVSCGGPLDRVRGIIQAPPNLSTWVDVPIKAMLEREFGCECRLENDANAGAVAEHRYGAGRGANDMVFLTMGTGLGAGIIANGCLYHGASDLAGEIGHVRLSRTGPTGHNKAGSVEGWASGGGMAQLAARAVAAASHRGEATLLAAGNGPLTAREVADAARQGDRVALRVIRSVGIRLGETLAILVDVLNPQRIVIGGLAMRMGELILGPARRSLRREALGPAVEACAIVPAELDERIGDVAALCVATGFGRQE